MSIPQAGFRFDFRGGVEVNKDEILACRPQSAAVSRSQDRLGEGLTLRVGALNLHK